MKTDKHSKKQTKISVTLDSHKDVADMFFRAMNEMDPRPTQVGIVIAALRDYLPRKLGLTVKNNGQKNQNADVNLEVSPQKSFSEAELEAAKKLAPELEKPIKRKKKRQ